jgi:hypothetical protein
MSHRRNTNAAEKEYKHNWKSVDEWVMALDELAELDDDEKAELSKLAPSAEEESYD